MKNPIYLFVAVWLLSVHIILAQPSIQWQKCFSGSGIDKGRSVQQTSDGGFIIAGSTSSNDGDASGNKGGDDFWIIKLDSAGNFLWQKCLGGTNTDIGNEILQTTDGGFVLVGTTKSNNGDVSGNHFNDDIWVVKLSSQGNIAWQKCYGGSSNETGNSIRQTTDGGFIVAGTTNSNDGDVSGLHGTFSELDFWVIKLSPAGVLEWQKCLGGSQGEIANAIQQTVDGGYIVAGTTTGTLNDGDVNGQHGSYDMWMVKLNSNGFLAWQKCLGSTASEGAQSIVQTSDGGFISTGLTSGNDGDVSGNHGSQDVWVVKVNSIGMLEWQKCLGGTKNESAYSVIGTIDGGFVVSGPSSSSNGDASSNQGSDDFWVLKIDETGNIIWQKSYGGSLLDQSLSIRQTSDGGFVMVGNSNSNNSGDVGNNFSNQGIWVVKLGPFATAVPDLQHSACFEISPNPSKGTFSLKSDATMLGQQFVIYNPFGKLVYQNNIKAENMLIALENLPAGIYSLQLKGQEGRTLRLVKE